MIAIGLVGMIIGVVIMYEPWEMVKCQGNSILAYVSFAWCFFWAIVNEGVMKRNERRRVVHPEPPTERPKKIWR